MRVLGSWLLLGALLSTGCQSEAGRTTVNARELLRTSPTLGAGMGHAIGVLTNDPDLTVPSTIAEASGDALFEFDTRAPGRSRVLSTPVGRAAAGETADAAGRRLIGELAGRFDASIWVADPAGQRTSATASAAAVTDTDGNFIMTFSEFSSAGQPLPLRLETRISFSVEGGFELTRTFTETGAGSFNLTTRFLGEYLPATDAFDFYMTDATAPASIKSNVKIMLRIGHQRVWFSETRGRLDGAEHHLENIRLVRR